MGCLDRIVGFSRLNDSVVALVSDNHLVGLVRSTVHTVAIVQAYHVRAGSQIRQIHRYHSRIHQSTPLLHTHQLTQCIVNLHAQYVEPC